MALFRELFESRTGGTTGAEGVFGESRLFRVVAEEEDLIIVGDGAGGESRREYPDPRALLGAQIPVGTIHPWDSSLLATSYSNMRRVGPITWDVRIDYKRNLNIVLPTNTEWLIRLRGASLSIPIVEEYPLSESSLRGARIAGGRIRQGVPKVTAEDTIKQIGVRNYQPVGSGVTGADFLSKEADEKGAVKTIFLRQTEQIIPHPVNDEMPAMVVEFSRIAPDFRLDPTGTFLADFQKVVNDREFRGAAPGHVRVETVNIDPIDGDMTGQAIPGRTWRIVIAFLWSAIPFTPLELVPQHRDNRGNSAPITHRSGILKDQKVVERFRNKRTRNLERLLSILEQG